MDEQHAQPGEATDPATGPRPRPRHPPFRRRRVLWALGLPSTPPSTDAARPN